MEIVTTDFLDERSVGYIDRRGVRLETAGTVQGSERGGRHKKRPDAKPRVGDQPADREPTFGHERPPLP